MLLFVGISKEGYRRVASGLTVRKYQPTSMLTRHQTVSRIQLPTLLRSRHRAGEQNRQCARVPTAARIPTRTSDPDQNVLARLQLGHFVLIVGHRVDGYVIDLGNHV